MIYLLQSVFEQELDARKNYLSMAFDSFFITLEKTPECIFLHSFPLVKDNIVILYGHNYWVRSLFLAYGNQFRNDLIIVNSCDFYDEKAVFTGQHDVYYSKADKTGRVYCYKGADFNLPFDVTRSELDMLNKRHLPLMERIRFAYRKVA